MRNIDPDDVVHLLYRTFSLYVNFLQELKKLRPRVLIFMAIVATLLWRVSQRPTTAIVAKAVVTAGAVAASLAVLGGVVAYLLRDTLFLSGMEKLPAVPEGEGALEDGQGLSARVSGKFPTNRIPKRFNGSTGGILFEADELLIVVPNQSFQILSGVSSERCHDWWRRPLDESVRRIELGTLYQAGSAHYAMRIYMGLTDRMVVGISDAKHFARALATIQQLNLPLD